MSTSNLYDILSSSLSKTRPAIIVSERFYDMLANPNSIELAARQSYRFSRMIIVNSHRQRLNFLRRCLWMAKLVVIIYNGYDLQEFVPPSDKPENALLNVLVIANV